MKKVIPTKFGPKLRTNNGELYNRKLMTMIFIYFIEQKTGREKINLLPEDFTFVEDRFGRDKEGIFRIVSSYEYNFSLYKAMVIIKFLKQKRCKLLYYWEILDEERPFC